MDEEILINVKVHKADIPLMSGESIYQFTRALTEEGRAHIFKSMGLSKDGGWAYLLEAYPGKAIYEIRKDNKAKEIYMAFGYARDLKTGTFNFDSPVEVRKVTQFMPVPVTGIAKASVSKAAGKPPPKPAKAAWDAAFINDLPDAAFAVVLPGGKKDAAGKTVPRSLRMLPHHGTGVTSPTENTSVDLPHLRNALARVNQISAPGAAKRQALAHLQAHSKELLKSSESSKPGQKATKAGVGGMLTYEG